MSSGVPKVAQDRGRLRGALCRVRRDPRVERLPDWYGGVQRRHRLLERRLGVDPVRVEDVEVLDTHPLE